MKATVLTAIFALILTNNILYASNDIIANKEISASMSISLMPTTPKEATFEDVIELNINALAPVTPIEADFSDVDYEISTAFVVLAPITPSEADPVVPAVAEIEDLN